MDYTEQEENRLLKNSIETENEPSRAPSNAARKIYRSSTIRDKKQSTQHAKVRIDQPSDIKLVQAGLTLTGTAELPMDPPGDNKLVQAEVTDPNAQQRKDKLGKLDDSFPRFGPIYQQESDPMQPDKKKAWQNAKKKAWHRVKYAIVGGVAKVTKEKILTAIRRVEKEAREAYSEKISGTRSDFRMMMIKDGCLFIQMAFMILGKSDIELGYPSDDPVFGGKTVKDISCWMEAMFYVGNQIPLVALKELIKQQFFQDLIVKGNWTPPVSDLRKQVLYEQLVLLPEPKNTQPDNRGLCFLINLIQPTARIEEQPSEVLHALHNLVLGPPSIDSSLNYKFGKYKGRFDDVDLEASNEEVYVDNEEIKFSSIMELKQVGIHIKKLKEGGPRKIHFKSFYFCARLYLPTLPIDADIASVFRNLRSYENNNKGLGKRNRELCSYISLMSNIIQTPQDLILLRRKGIIEGDMDYAEQLPGILGRLSSKDVKLTYNLRNVRRQITNFSSPLVRYQTVLNLVFILTLVQATFAVLAYFKPPRDN